MTILKYEDDAAPTLRGWYIGLKMIISKEGSTTQQDELNSAWPLLLQGGS